MSIALQFDYYYGEEVNQYHFYRIPKALFTDARFKDLSAEAKILYGLMLDRTGLSTRNGWLDANGRVYIYFTLDDAIDMLGFGHNKVVRLFRELEEIGLIERKKQGQGRPARIYVKRLALSLEQGCANEDAETSENGKSERGSETGQRGAAQEDGAEDLQMGKPALPQEGSLDFPKGAGNKNEINKTEKNYTENPIHLSGDSCGESRLSESEADRMRWMDYYREQIRENIEYDTLQRTQPLDIERIDGYVGLMVEVCCSKKASMRINQEDVPTTLARERFLLLTREHILYVLECMDKTTSLIRNIRAYTLSALYNAPTTMEQYYFAMVNHDFSG